MRTAIFNFGLSYSRCMVSFRLPMAALLRRFLGWLLAFLVVAGAFEQVVHAQTPSSVADLAKRANESREANQLDRAVDLYGQAVKQQPSWVEGWWYLGSIEYKLLHYQLARDAFRRATLLTPKNGAAWAQMGLCEYELGQYALALRSLDRGSKLGFGENQDLPPLVLFHTALLLTRNGQFEQSTGQLAMFVAAGNHSPEVVLGLGLSTLHMPIVPSQIPPAKRDLVLKAGEAAWALHARNGEEAKRLYAELAATYPKERNVHCALGMYWLDSDPALAFQEFKQELQINPSDVVARLQLASLELKQGSPADSLAMGLTLLKVVPGDYRVHRILGRSYLQMNRIGESIPELKRSAVLAPQDSETHFYLAQAYREAGIKTGAEREQAAFERLKSADNRQISIAGLWYFAGQYYQKHRFPEARDSLLKITQEDPKDGDAWAMLGLCDYELQNFQDALEHLSEAEHQTFSGGPEMESASHYYSALLLNRAGKFAESAQQLSWFAGQKSVSPQIIEAIGINTLRLKFLPPEIPAESHDLVMKAGQAGWWLNLGEKEKARALFAELAAAYPAESYLHYFYGVCLERENDPAAALQEFQKELDINPSNVDAQSEMVFAYLKEGERDKALQAAQAAVKMAPSEFLPHNVLGWALVANRQLDRAIEEMSLATRLAPDAPITHYSLAQAYKAAGRNDDAQKEFARFEDLTKTKK